MLHPREAAHIQAHLTKSLRPNLLNSLLRALTLSHSPQKVLLIFNLIIRTSSPHDHFTYTYTVKACSLLHATTKGREVHARVAKSGHHSDLFIQNSLINFYSAVDDAASARRLFAGVPNPDVVSWTSIISALSRSGYEQDALLAFASMDADPNSMTLVSVLPACSHLKALKLGRSIHGYSIRRFHYGNIILDNTILDMYMGCGASTAARQLFDEMPDRDVVSWTTMVSGYVQNGCPERAIRAFCTMLHNVMVAPNEVTLVSVLGACASKGALSLGKWVHSFSYRRGIGMDGFMGNALINMYAKCGDVCMALKVFCRLPCKDLVSWCTVIRGMAMNGRTEEAFQLFALMLCHGVPPDGATFVALLAACSHARLVDQGVIIFKAMGDVYGIVPQKEHYTCMVDMYGRAGRFGEAEELVCRMPVEPDRHTWGALIGAWKIHGGDEAACKQLKWRFFGGEMDVGPGTYVLISNVLSNAGKWLEANNMRELMRMRKIKKAVGYSWIEAHRSESLGCG